MFECVVRRLRALMVAGLIIAAAAPAGAATLPAGFSESLLASGLSSPTAMQFAPDGRLFVCEQSGTLRVIENGLLLATPFLSLSVNAEGERGLLGVAFDPNFAANQYVYVYYTAATTPRHNRISRVTANGNVAVPGSEVVVMDLDDLSSATNHNGGAIDFGPDGKLYVAVGDNAFSANSQSLSTRHGKMLRLNANGSIPSDNPTSFAGIAGTTSGANRAIWAAGLRNPFTFAQNPGGSPAMLINDVGQFAYEEVDVGAAGANFGWPSTEGEFDPATFPDFTRPRYAYPHNGGTTTGCAVTGGAFYTPATPSFPAEYQGTYFFADYCSGWIKRIDPTVVQGYPLQAAVAVDFASGISSTVDLKVWTDGALYYLARGNGSVYRVQFGASAPTITSHPANRTVSVGQSATFSVTAAGTAPLSYRWQRNQVDIAGAAGASSSYALSNAQPTDSGAQFRVNVSNNNGNVFSNAAVLTVSANVPPVAAITAPVAGVLYTAGTTITFAGTGTDPDGTPPLPASAFSWRVDFHHDTHDHPFLPTTTGVTGGSFVIPTTGETSANVWYRIYLTVTDPFGLTHTVQRDLFPQTVRLTLATSPTGLQVELDGQPVTAPLSFDSVVGIVRTIAAPTQSVAGITYNWTEWSDGGAPGRTLATPPVATTYTATYAAVIVPAPPATPTSFASVVNGASVRLSWNRSAGAQSYVLEAGTEPGLADLVNSNVGDVASVDGLVPPGTYFVRVRAANAVGVSAPSNQLTVAVTTTASCVTAPPAPTGYTAQTGGVFLALAWTASPAATAYLFEAGLSSGVASFPAASLGAGTTLQGVAPPGTYYTRLRAANACGVSAPSTELPVTLGCTATSVVPTGLTVTQSGGAAVFSWLPPLGATGYRLQVGSTSGAANLADVSVGPETTLPVSLAGVPAGAYYIRVTAESACGVSAPSNEVALTVS